MAGEKHRGAPKKQMKKPSAKSKDKAAKKLTSQLNPTPQPRTPAEAGWGEGGGSA